MKKIVFVCLGNICRSPMAEFVMKELDKGEFFDLVVGMDESNVENLLQISAGRYDDKIKLFRPGGVPDPWYTGDFEETYKLVTAGCRDWLQWIKDRQ